jgi:hypothetical protein
MASFIRVFKSPPRNFLPHNFTHRISFQLLVVRFRALLVFLHVLVV